MLRLVTRSNKLLSCNNCRFQDQWHFILNATAVDKKEDFDKSQIVKFSDTTFCKCQYYAEYLLAMVRDRRTVNRR